MFLVSTVQEMTCIFNDKAKTKPKVKLTMNKRKTNITGSRNLNDNRRKSAVAKMKESINHELVSMAWGR